MMSGAPRSGSLYWLTSVPQTPATSIFSSAASGGISGRSNSRSSVVEGPVFTAASDFPVAVMSSKSTRSFGASGSFDPLASFSGPNDQNEVNGPNNPNESNVRTTRTTRTDQAVATASRLANGFSSALGP